MSEKLKAIETLKEFQKDIKAYLNSFEEDDCRDEEYLNASLTAVKIKEVIQELEELNKNISSSIEEIEYAIAKPQYAEVYLNNAIRFLKE